MQEIDLNIIPKGIPDVVNVSQFDVNRELKFTLYDETQIYTIPDGAIVEIGGRKKDTTIFDYQATISSDHHSVSVLTTEQMTAIAGDNLCQIRINKDGGTIATVNFIMRVQERPDVGDIESVSDIPAIISLAREEQYNAEAWAKGTKNGTDVTSSDPQYNNHAKYWAEQAEAELNNKTNLSVIAEEFDSTASYAVGDYVIYNGVLYKCITAHTGAWDASDFTATLVSDEFGSGGGTADITVIAAEFSTSTAYAVGDYVTYEGDLYICTTAHSAGAWNASDFTQTTVDNELDNRVKKTGDTMSGKLSIIGASLENGGGAQLSASGVCSHAEGEKSKATGNFSHAEGDNTQAQGKHSHTEGFSTLAKNAWSHAEGEATSAEGNSSHSEGYHTKTSHASSHAEGYYTKTGASYQHVEGKYNVGKATTLWEVGNGTGDNARANAAEISTAGDLTVSGEIVDGASNQLSDKYDANSFVLQKFRVTVASSAWSATATDGYYTCDLTLPYPINTYKEFGMDKTGSADGVDPTAAELAAYSLVNYMDANDGTGVTSVTLRAKTKPTTTFYIMVHGYYMQRNAATSGVALDIETANNLNIIDGNGTSTGFDGGTTRTYRRNNVLATISSSNWSSTVDSDGYYTNSVSLGVGYNTYDGVHVGPIGSTKDTRPTAAQGAAYNLVDDFEMADGTNVSTIVAKAKTKPTETFYVLVQGDYIS